MAVTFTVTRDKLPATKYLVAKLYGPEKYYLHNQQGNEAWALRRDPGNHGKFCLTLNYVEEDSPELTWFLLQLG
jgi:hypothetical protein